MKLVQQRDSEDGPSIALRCKKLSQQSNVEADVLEVYYKRTLTILFLNNFLNELGERFTTHAYIASLGVCLIPKVLMERGIFMYKALPKCTKSD